MFMQIFILNREELLPRLLNGFLEAGVRGSTVIDCKGGLQVLGASDPDDTPIFGALRQFLIPTYQSGKLILTIVKQEEQPKLRAVIEKVVGDLSKPGTGILFTIPVSNVEGMAK